VSCKGNSSGNLPDIREEILKNVSAKRVAASIVADDSGIIAGTTFAVKEIERLELELLMIAGEGQTIGKGAEVSRFAGTPKQIVMAEETLIGLLAKSSGIATSALRFADATGGKPQIVSGAWKKMPPSLKEIVRDAVKTGGASPRIISEPFAYLDKNYIELLGGVRKCLAALSHMGDIVKVVQVKGRYGDIASEACEAAESGAGVVFIDSGNSRDIARVSERLSSLGLRDKVRLAFGGGIKLEDIYLLKIMDVDILDIGRPIVDAPLLDMRLEITGIQK
jgi:nicotinate-nucleotide pyrophosphorylase (carboxylating)